MLHVYECANSATYKMHCILPRFNQVLKFTTSYISGLTFFINAAKFSSKARELLLPNVKEHLLTST